MKYYRNTRSSCQDTSEIIIGKRLRRELGDINSLAQSIEDVGLLHPIVIRPNNRLIAGLRRLKACKDVLGWTKIPVTIVRGLQEAEKVLRAQQMENTCRKDLLPSEMVDRVDDLIEMESSKAMKRRKGGKKVSGSKGQSAAIAAKMEGISEPTYRKAKYIKERARKSKKIKPLLDEMDNKPLHTSRIDPIYQKAKRMEEGKPVEKTPLEEMEAAYTLCIRQFKRLKKLKGDWDKLIEGVSKRDREKFHAPFHTRLVTFIAEIEIALGY